MAITKSIVADMFSSDLMLEIISWLPIRSVLRFKSVCKLWHSIISDPYFISTHTCRHAVSEIIFSVGAFSFYCSLNVDDAPVTHLLPHPPFSNMLKQTVSITHTSYEMLGIQASYLGGMLLYQLHVSSNKNTLMFFYYLHNPITMDFKQIPMPEPGLNFHESYSKSMVLIPYNCVIMLEYVRLENYRLRCLVRLYSFQTGKWENCGKSFVHEGWFLHASAVFWNGHANWISLGNASYNLFIMSFNIKNYKWREIQLPNKYDGTKLNVVYFRESKDHLHLIVSEEGHRLVFDILELAKDFSKWSSLYHVDFEEAYGCNIIKENFCPVIYFMFESWPLNTLQRVRKKNDKLFFRSRNKILLYNLMNKTMCEVVPDIDGLNPYLYNYYDVVSYRPTLAFPSN